jgi:type II secretory pathway pseudopilin PulG
MLELLMVVTVIAVVSGALIYAQGDTQETTKVSIAHAEMNEIRSAIDRFKLDNLSEPSSENPADFSFLFERGTLAEWNVYVSRGWRGPYLRTAGEGYVDIGDNLTSSGTGSPAMVDATPHENVRSIADSFVQRSIASDSNYAPCSESQSDTNCLLDWRTQPGDSRHERWGRPYLLFDLLNSARSRLMSSGPNGRYESQNCSNVDCEDCSPGGDDILLCLIR